MSRRENLKPFYKRLPGESKASSIVNEREYNLTYENWDCDYSSNGYRLPTEHEFEFACRDGTISKYSFGFNRKYRDDYIRSSNHLKIPALAVRSKLSNRLGMYDTTGNLWERTNDWYNHLEKKEKLHLTDPVGPNGPSTKVTYPSRTIRGGGVGSSRGDNDAESRGNVEPQIRLRNLGFRIGRYADSQK